MVRGKVTFPASPSHIVWNSIDQYIDGPPSGMAFDLTCSGISAIRASVVSMRAAMELAF